MGRNALILVALLFVGCAHPVPCPVAVTVGGDNAKIMVVPTPTRRDCRTLQRDFWLHQGASPCEHAH